MSGNPKQKLKLLYISDYLQKFTDESHPASTEAIMAYLREQGIGAERKSVYNDIEVLKEYGLLIEHSRAEPRGFFIANGGLEPGELIMLAGALQASPVISRGKTNMLVKKLRQLVSVHQTDAVDSLIEQTSEISGMIGERSGFIKTDNEEMYQNVTTISRAIAQGSRLSFIYRRRVLVGNIPVFNNGREFVVSPYATIWNDDRYYLVANNDKYDDLSHYRIDRMRMVAVVDQPARPVEEVTGGRPRFDAAEYARGLFNMYSGGEEMSVQLICRDALLETMVERFGLNTVYRQLPNGFFSLRTRVRVNRGFISWLLGFGGDVVVDEPTELAGMVKERLEEMLRQY